MSPSTPPETEISTRLRRARLGVVGIFFVVGLGMAAWLVSIPAVQQRTGVSHATLGLLLLVLGAGGVIGMQIAGYAISRWGSRIVTGVALGVYVIAVNLPVHTTGSVTLGLALRWAGDWPEMGRRYDGPGVSQGRPGPDHSMAPEAAPDPQEGDLSDGGLWKALDEGRDPTV